jgi:hypothetical protein
VMQGSASPGQCHLPATYGGDVGLLAERSERERCSFLNAETEGPQPSA